MPSATQPQQGRALPPVLVVLLGLVVHVILTYSVIDIHFQTPIVRGISPQSMHHPGPAKRVVVLVADGLRADKLYEVDEHHRSPWLRRQALEHGCFGISHTRPPTESRPGHVAMLAGFYEDPSALFSGWSVNPVAFDSVFNHSIASWGFGSPDVVPMFEGQRGYSWDAYAAELEDFGRDDLTVLDVWTFNRTEALLKDVAANASHPLHAGPAILFLHLLGLDSNAHAHGGPSAHQYLDNIRLVDDLTAKLVQQIDEMFGDNATAYLYTADHGMSDQASHGDGSPQNTETPYVVWGAGVAQCSSSQSSSGSGNSSGSGKAGTCSSSPTRGGAGSEWGYDSPGRADIEQAQLTPLIAALLGTPCPVNSIGLLPTRLLAGTPAFRAHAAWANARQLLAAHDKKEEGTRAGSLRYVPHRGLSELRGLLVSAIEAALGAADYAQAQKLAEQLAREALKGVEYLQRYDTTMLMGTVTLGFLGWMTFILLQLLLAARVGDTHRRAAARSSGALLQASTGAGDTSGSWGGMYVLPRPAVGVFVRAAANGGSAAETSADHGSGKATAAESSSDRVVADASSGAVAGASPAEAASLPASGVSLLSARALGACVLALALGLLARMNAPLTYYAYAVLPCVFWTEVVHHKGIVAAALSSALATPTQRLQLAAELPAVTGLLLAMAAGFQTRWLYSIITPLAALLAVLPSPASRHPAAAQLLLSFSVAGAFTLMPTSKSLANRLVAVAGVAAAAVVLALTRRRGTVSTETCATSTGSSDQLVQPSSNQNGGKAHRLTALQLVTVAAAGIVVLLAQKGAGGALQSLLHALAWVLFVGCPLLPLLSQPQWQYRWRALLLGLLPPFMLVSLCWEPLFYAAMAVAVDAWLRFDAMARAAAAGDQHSASNMCSTGQGEGQQTNGDADSTDGFSNKTAALQQAGSQLNSVDELSGVGPSSSLQQKTQSAPGQQHRLQRKPHPLWVVEQPEQPQQPTQQQQHHQQWQQQQQLLPASGWQDVHNALLFLLLIQLGFFGQGNTATIASFDLASVYRLVTRFNPFAMTAILLVKLFIPFVVATAGLCMLAKRAHKQRFSLYLLVLVLSDVMALKFFFAVRSHGSWMEIGSSLGFYGILNGQVVCLLLLFLLTQAYIHDAVPDDET